MKARRIGPWAAFVEALRFALSGLHYAVRTQRNFRVQLVCAAIIAGLAFWLRIPPVAAAVVALAMSVVLVAELFNTGVEAIIDLLVERNHHDLAKMAKDIAAAGVLVSVLGAVIAGGVVLGPPLLVRLGAAAPWPIRAALAGALLVLLVTGVVLLGMLRRPSPDERRGGAPAQGR